LDDAFIFVSHEMNDLHIVITSKYGHNHAAQLKMETKEKISGSIMCASTVGGFYGAENRPGVASNDPSVGI
jgi:hypothetical protein